MMLAVTIAQCDIARSEKVASSSKRNWDACHGTEWGVEGGAAMDLAGPKICTWAGSSETLEYLPRPVVGFIRTYHVP